MYPMVPRLTPVLFCGAVLAGSPVQAGEAPTRVLEEIIVTAQKRAESLQDVPISISTVSGEKMTENAIFKIDDLQAFVPNLSMTETGLSTQVLIRGIGSGNNPAFEQSVGTYVDGIHYGRSQLLRLPFLDLERVEVLRGPQSILFGKNSIAGALNLTTAAPTDVLEGQASINYSADGGAAEYTGVISGPISERLSGRLAARQLDEDGWMKNTFKGQDEVERDESAVRLSLRWDASDDLRVDLKAEWAEFDNVGRPVEIVKDDSAVAGPFQGLNFAQILGVVGYPGALEHDEDNRRQTDGRELSNNEVRNVTLNVDLSVGELTVTAISAFLSYEFDEIYDGDWVGAPMFLGGGGENYEQFSQELRVASPTGGTIDWIAGVFYQTSELRYYDRLIFPANSVLSALLPPAGPILGSEVARDFQGDSDLAAVFAQATWHFGDRTHLAVGGRYTWEDKKGFREVNILDSASGAVTSSPVVPIIWSALGIASEQAGGHSIAASRSEAVFTPLINLVWDATDDTMLYGTYSTGFKAGGFDARANSPSYFEFRDEEATTFEVGAKSTFFNGATELNVALYRTEYDNLQTSQFDGGLGFTVGNAKETVVQGIELDGRWAMTESLAMNFGLAYLDHEYKDFRNGNCYAGQVPDGDVVNGIPLCDYSGKSGWYTPELSGILSLRHVTALPAGLTLQSNFDVSYQGEQNVHVNLDPNGEIDATTRMNLRLALQAQSWELALLVQNLTDEQPLTLVSDVALTSSFGTSTYNAFVTRPRTTYLRASYHF
ncbi:MAG: TonB-dependent receptor [Pseudomonadales bacterium]|nr:TonB-dependent receptor [Pseudomonadales bacterium]